MASTEVRRHNEKVMRNLKKGDLVEIPRGGYSHWAVYVGNGDVIHITGVGAGVSLDSASGSLFTICGQQFEQAEVRLEDFHRVVGQSKAKKNNKLDNEESPGSGEQIVERARGILGEMVYDVVWNNCEHVVTFCRYGVPRSLQVENVFYWVFVALPAAILFFCFERFRRLW